MTLHTLFSWIYIAWAIRIDVYKSEARYVRTSDLLSILWLRLYKSNCCKVTFGFIYSLTAQAISIQLRVCKELVYNCILMAQAISIQLGMCHIPSIRFITSTWRLLYLNRVARSHYASDSYTSILMAYINKTKQGM